MGLNIFLRSFSSYDALQKSVEKVFINSTPDPSDFKIIRHSFQGNYALIQINYPSVKNYEGDKIMLYEGLKFSDLQSYKHWDPHFSNSEKFKSPIARFEPTLRGWDMGLLLMDRLSYKT